jgi:hypothetical protein
MSDAIKAGRRNSDADYQRMRKAYKLAEEMMQTLRDMGYTDFDGDTEEELAIKAERYGGVERSELQMNDFVFPEERKFPVMTRGDVQDAVSSWGRYKGPADFGTFKRRLISIAKRKGLESALPAGWKEEAGMKADMELADIHEMVCEAVEDALVELALLEPDDDMGDDRESMMAIMDDYGKGYDEQDDEDEDDLKVYVYADYAVACIRQGVDWKIPYSIEDGMVILAAPRTWQRVEQVWAPIESSAVKMMDDGTIVAQAVRFGSPEDPDISAYRDYFTKSTDFWLDRWQQRPMLYHHAQDEATADAPVIGTWMKAWVDDTGVWLQGQIDKAHKYAEAIKDMARRGLLKISTDSAPHLIKRRPGPNGTNHVERWPLVAASLTPTPAEPRLMPVSVKSASIATDDPDTAGSERRDGAEAAAERDRLVQDINRLMESL